MAFALEEAAADFAFEAGGGHRRNTDGVYQKHRRQRDAGSDARHLDKGVAQTRELGQGNAECVARLEAKTEVERGRNGL